MKDKLVEEIANDFLDFEGLEIPIIVSSNRTDTNN